MPEPDGARTEDGGLVGAVPLQPGDLPRELEGLGSHWCSSCYAIIGEESMCDGYCSSCGEPT